MFSHLNLQIHVEDLKRQLDFKIQGPGRQMRSKLDRQPCVTILMKSLILVPQGRRPDIFEMTFIVYYGLGALFCSPACSFPAGNQIQPEMESSWKSNPAVICFNLQLPFSDSKISQLDNGTGIYNWVV